MSAFEVQPAPESPSPVGNKDATVARSAFAEEPEEPLLDFASNLSPDVLKALQAHMGGGDEGKTAIAIPITTDTSTASEPAAPVNETFEKRQRKGRETNKQFAEKSYWDERFVEEDEFDWLCSFKQCAEHVLPLLGSKESNPRILLVGVGSSSFSADLYDAGYRNLVNLDFSEVIIDKMKKENEELRPEMQWVCMDMLDMKGFPDASFDVVLDKAAMVRFLPWPLCFVPTRSSFFLFVNFRFALLSHAFASVIAFAFAL
jgi:hypothetical protein